MYYVSHIYICHIGPGPLPCMHDELSCYLLLLQFSGTVWNCDAAVSWCSWFCNNHPAPVGFCSSYTQIYKGLIQSWYMGHTLCTQTIFSKNENGNETAKNRSWIWNLYAKKVRTELNKKHVTGILMRIAKKKKQTKIGKMCQKWQSWFSENPDKNAKKTYVCMCMNVCMCVYMMSCRVIHDCPTRLCLRVATVRNR